MSAQQLAERVRDGLRGLREEMERQQAIDRERTQKTREMLRSIFEFVPGGTWREQ